VSKRFNVDVPAHLLEKLDDAALLRGVTRQALVKTWLYDRLMQERSK
jgi:metal-responsive CopG/Arc/MetJ family transcriptional regulator